MDKNLEISINKYLDGLRYLNKMIETALEYIKQDKEIKKPAIIERKEEFEQNVILSKLEDSTKNDEYMDYLTRTNLSLKYNIDIFEKLLTNTLECKLFINFISNACLIMEQLSLSTNDRFNVILFLFNQDLEKILNCEKKYDINYENILTWDFKYANVNEIMYMQQINEINAYLNRNFTGEKKLKQDELRAYVSKNKIELKNIFEAKKEIKKHYLDKNGEINEDDIDHIVNALNMSYIKPELIDRIKLLLQKKIKNEEIEIKTNYNNFQDKFKEKEEEKQKLRNELSNYIDLRNMYPNHTLTIDEVNRVLYILKFLKYEREDIKEFLIANERDLYTMDTVSKYMYLHDRFEYYKERYGLVQEVKDLDDYYNEFNNSESGDDKKFYKNCLKDGMEFVLKIIPTTFEYELRGV